MPWDPGTATGLGPLPGVDPMETARMVFSELPDLPFLPELPARGVGADPVGRTAKLLADLHVVSEPESAGRTRSGATPSGPTSPHHDLAPSKNVRRVRRGLKGKDRRAWTLAASIELPKGRRPRDPGAVGNRRLADRGLTGHLDDIATANAPSRVGQIDEPAPGRGGGEWPPQRWGRSAVTERAGIAEGLSQSVAAGADVAASGSAPPARRDLPKGRGGLTDDGAVIESSRGRHRRGIAAGSGCVACVPLDGSRAPPAITAPVRSSEAVAFPSGRMNTTVA